MPVFFERNNFPERYPHFTWYCSLTEISPSTSKQIELKCISQKSRSLIFFQMSICIFYLIKMCYWWVGNMLLFKCLKGKSLRTFPNCLSLSSFYLDKHSSMLRIFLSDRSYLLGSSLNLENFHHQRLSSFNFFVVREIVLVYRIPTLCLHVR